MVQQRIMVLGAGPAGLAAARELTDHALEVVLVEQRPQWGGKAAAYACKATDRCLACGVCLLLDLFDDMQQRSNLVVHLQTQLVKWQSLPGGGFVASLSNAAGEEWNEAVSALVVATGFEPFPAQLLPDLGHSRYPGVIGADQLEERLRSEGGLYVDGSLAQRIAFIQCAGSRNRLLGADYCSTVCCQYAIRMALSMQQDHPATEVTIFYMDLQTHARGFDEILAQAEKKLQLVQGVPVAVERLPEGGLSVKYEDVLKAQVQSAQFDAVVLSQGIRPGYSTEALGRLLGINRDEHGFFARRDFTQVSSYPNIYIAGCAGGPGDIRQSIASGRACAAALMSREQGVSAC